RYDLDLPEELRGCRRHLGKEIGRDRSWRRQDDRVDRKVVALGGRDTEGATVLTSELHGRGPHAEAVGPDRLGQGFREATQAAADRRKRRCRRAEDAARRRLLRAGPRAKVAELPLPSRQLGEGGIHAQAIDVSGVDPRKQRTDERVRRAATQPPSEERANRLVAVAAPTRD